MSIPTTKYGSTYYKTFIIGVCCNYHGFFQCVWYYVSLKWSSFCEQNQLEKVPHRERWKIWFSRIFQKNCYGGKPSKNWGFLRGAGHV